MKYYLLLALMFSTVNCSSISNNAEKGSRAPNEVTAGLEGEEVAPSFRERTVYLYSNLEIPAGSFFKRKDVEILRDKCEVRFRRDVKNNNGYMTEVDSGIYFGIDKTNTTVGMGAASLPITLGCPNGVCEFVSEYLPAPHNMVQITKIWLDPYMQNVTRSEIEFRRGPKGTPIENMALQLKHTCTPEFIGM